MSTEPRLTPLTEEQKNVVWDALKARYGYVAADKYADGLGIAQLAADQKVLDEWVQRAREAEGVLGSIPNAEFYRISFAKHRLRFGTEGE